MKLLGALLAAVTLALTSTAVAQPAAAPEKADRPMQRHQRMMSMLNLTEQQRDQVEKLRIDQQKAATDTHAKIRIARLELRELFLADKLDRGAIEKKVDAISDLQRKAKSQMVDHLFAVYGVLTPEQQKIWKDHMGAMGMGEGPRWRMHQRGHGMGRGMGPGMGEELNDENDAGPGLGLLDSPSWLGFGAEDETFEAPAQGN